MSHVQAGTAAAPGDVVAPALTPQTQTVVQTVEKQLADQRQPFLSFQAPLCLCSEVPEAASSPARSAGPHPLLVPAALPIQMHFLTVVAEVTTPTARRGTRHLLRTM